MIIFPWLEYIQSDGQKQFKQRRSRQYTDDDIAKQAAPTSESPETFSG
jgi:hypothetical protein